MKILLVPSIVVALALLSCSSIDPVAGPPSSEVTTDRVVHVKQDAWLTPRIVSENADGSDERLLVDSARPLSPVFGGRILVESVGSATDSAAIKVIDLSTRRSHRITTRPLSGVVATLIPGGQFVAWSDWSSSQLWISRYDGSGRVLLAASTHIDISGMAASPDGRWLAYVIGYKGHVVSVDGARSFIVDLYAPRGIGWSPDSRKVWFGGTRGRIFEVTREGLREVANTHEDIAFPNWEPTGSRIAGVIAYEIGIVNAEGFMKTIAKAVQWVMIGPVWSPSGKYILYSDGYRHWIVDAGTMEKREVPDGFGFVFWSRE